MPPAEGPIPFPEEEQVVQSSPSPSPLVLPRRGVSRPTPDTGAVGRSGRNRTEHVPPPLSRRGDSRRDVLSDPSVLGGSFPLVERTRGSLLSKRPDALKGMISVLYTSGGWVPRQGWGSRLSPGPLLSPTRFRLGRDLPRFSLPDSGWVSTPTPDVRDPTPVLSRYPRPTPQSGTPGVKEVVVVVTTTKDSSRQRRGGCRGAPSS